MFSYTSEKKQTRPQSDSIKNPKKEPHVSQQASLLILLTFIRMSVCMSCVVAAFPFTLAYSERERLLKALHWDDAGSKKRKLL